MNKNGICSLIIDFSFFERPFVDIRKFILTSYHIREIVSNLTAFQSVSSGQLILSLDSKYCDYTIWKENLDGQPQTVDISACITDRYYCISKPNPYQDILEKIEKESFPLEQIGDVRTGVNIGGVKQYFICNNSKYPPYISGGDNIQSYHINYPTKLQIRRGETNFKFDKSIEKYIWDNKIGTPSIGENNDRFIRPKLIIRQSDVKITAAIDLYNRFHCGYSLFTINVADNNINLLLCLLGILNSKLITYYMLNKGWIKIAPGKNPQIRVEHIKKIPIFSNYMKDMRMENLIKLVNMVLNKKSQNSDSILKEIDKIVYEMYKMTDSEIKIIEKNI